MFAKMFRCVLLSSHVDGFRADLPLITDMLTYLTLGCYSANVLFLASTVMVPIGNVAFSLNFVPHHQDLNPSDTMGLVFILTGMRCLA